MIVTWKGSKWAIYWHLDDKAKPDLQGIAQALGLPTTGSKKDLLKHIIHHFDGNLEGSMYFQHSRQEENEMKVVWIQGLIDNTTQCIIIKNQLHVIYRWPWWVSWQDENNSDKWSLFAWWAWDIFAVSMLSFASCTLFSIYLIDSWAFCSSVFSSVSWLLPTRGGSKQDKHPVFRINGENPVDVFIMFMMLNHTFGSALPIFSGCTQHDTRGIGLLFYLYVWMHHPFWGGMQWKVCAWSLSIS